MRDSFDHSFLKRDRALPLIDIDLQHLIGESPTLKCHKSFPRI